MIRWKCWYRGLNRWSKQVARARVIINLTGTRESINQALDVQLYNTNNQLLKGLSINPPTVLVNIPVSQQGGYRDVTVKVIVQGQVANGYLLTDLSVFPPIVTVYSTDPIWSTHCLASWKPNRSNCAVPARISPPALRSTCRWASRWWANKACRWMWASPPSRAT